MQAGRLRGHVRPRVAVPWRHLCVMARAVVTEPQIDPLDQSEEVKVIAERAGFARPYSEQVFKALDAVEHVEQKRRGARRPTPNARAWRR